MNKIINILKEKKSIPLDQFINISLYDEKFGYYMKKNPFGKRGDFITSPLVSNLFGEMLAIWCVSFWENIGRPSKILFFCRSLIMKRIFQKIFFLFIYLFNRESIKKFISYKDYRSIINFIYIVNPFYLFIINF